MEAFNAGNTINQGTYSAFIPNFINKKWDLSNQELQYLLSKADRQLGRLDSFSRLINIDFYVKMHVTKEATLSSRIEGTQTNLQEALMDKEDVTIEHRDDWEEVQNYIKATKQAELLMQELPVSSRLIRRLHAVLMQGVRGQHKLPGEFRSSQNWIGGNSLKTAVFVPPPHSHVGDLMSDLEKFANDDRNLLPELLKIALIHYQFETIHPFLDGNGRIGRLLISVYLVSKGILDKPMLYLSAYFEANRREYYDRLTAVRTNNDLTGWCNFFLRGVIDTAEDGIQTFRKTLDIERSMPERLQGLAKRSFNANLVVQQLFADPIVDVEDVRKIIGTTPTPAYKLVAELERLNILREIPSSRRGKLYAFQDYIDLFA